MLWRQNNAEVNHSHTQISGAVLGETSRSRQRGMKTGTWNVRSLYRAGRRWVDNIRTYLQEVGCGYMDWIRLAQDRDRWRTLVSVVMNLRVPWNARNFLISCKPASFSRRALHHGVSNYIEIMEGGLSYVASNDSMICDRLERTWQEVAVAWINILFGQLSWTKDKYTYIESLPV